MKIQDAYKVAKSNLEIDEVRNEVEELLKKAEDEFGLSFKFPFDTSDERFFSDEFPFINPIIEDQRNSIGCCTPHLLSMDVDLSPKEELNTFFEKLNRSTLDIEAYKVWATEAPLYVYYDHHLYFKLGKIQEKDVFVKIVDMNTERELEA